MVVQNNMMYVTSTFLVKQPHNVYYVTAIYCKMLQTKVWDVQITMDYKLYTMLACMQLCT